jgi:DNA-directed RNA polymerase specialized sigma24 family protein
MSKPGDNRTMIRQGRLFPTTHWTDILSAQSHDESRQQAALEELLRRYWKPIYCFLRCKGYHEEKAEDVTQGFFHEIVLGRNLIRQAQRAKGRFRTFLLNALDRYATSVHRAERAKRRVPEGGLLSVESIERLRTSEPIHCTTPVGAFDYAWASALLDCVLADMARECREAGEAIHWEVFRTRVLLPIMNGTEPCPLTKLCEKHGVSSRKKASNMVITVKRRLRGVLRRHLRQFVGSDSEIDEEIRDLMKIFRGGAAS